jgi:hypothetical protein
VIDIIVRVPTVLREEFSEINSDLTDFCHGLLQV